MIAAICSTFSCSTKAPEPARRETTEQQTDDLSIFGTERVIPLRLVMMAYDCNYPPAGQPGTCTSCTDGAGDCGPDTANYAEIRHAVERLNAIMRPLAVQFYVERIEKYKMPEFWDVSSSVEWYWTHSAPPNPSLQAQLMKALPSLTSSSFDALDKFTAKRWLAAATIRAGEARELVVFVSYYSSGFDGRRPWGGAASLVGDQWMFRIPFKLTHELGHIMGLEHTMYPGAANPQFPQYQGSKNPEKLYDTDWGDNWDYWELVYGVEQSGALHYFTTRSDAFNWWNMGLPLYVKHRWDVNGANQNCSPDANCTMKCCLGEYGRIDIVTKQCISGTPVTIGDPGIAGLGFTFQGDNPGQGVYRRGWNAMMYLNNEQSNACEQWVSFTESQAEQVKRLLRADIRIDSGEVGAAMSSCVPSTGYRCFTAKRHLLGDYRARWSIERLDFDQHASRDLAVWQPPSDAGGVCGDGICGIAETASSCATDCSSAYCGDGFCHTGIGETTTCPKDCGAFRTLLSGSGYTTLLERNLGRIGDVPVPALYDNDSYTDFAVVRRGGLYGNDPFDSGFWWVWCKSGGNPSNPDCVNFGAEPWGWQYDVPLAGLEFDGNTATHEVATYRPSSKTVAWKVIGQGTQGSITLTTLGNRLVHLHGLYDADNKTDLAFYEPELAKFTILRSSTNWDPAQPTVRTFDAALKADAMGAADAGTSAPAIRHGGVALPAEAAGRRVLRVWDPYTGNWHTNWDPINSSTIQTIQWGAPRDVALAGPIDRNGDGKTDLVVFRPTMTPPTVCICSPGRLSTCAEWLGNIYQFPVSGATARSVISAVPDISGDGLGDLIIVDPDQLTWRRFHSPNFVEQSTLSLGDLGAMIL